MRHVWVKGYYNWARVPVDAWSMSKNSELRHCLGIRSLAANQWGLCPGCRRLAIVSQVGNARSNLNALEEAYNSDTPIASSMCILSIS